MIINVLYYLSIDYAYAFAPVAQLDRVFGYEPKGRGFESLPAYQIMLNRQNLFSIIFYQCGIRTRGSKFRVLLAACGNLGEQSGGLFDSKRRIPSGVPIPLNRQNLFSIIFYQCGIRTRGSKFRVLPAACGNLGESSGELFDSGGESLPSHYNF